MKFKRILSILLSVAMIVSMCVIPASAEEPFTLELSVTPETVSSTNTIANGSDVTVSVKYKNWPENIDTFKVLLGYDHTKLSATNSNIKPQEVVLQGDEDTPVITKNNNTSTHKINFSLAYVQPSKAAESGTLFTVTFKATTDISEKLDFTFAVDQLYMNSTGVNKPSDATAPTGISVAEALTGNLPVTITAPVKGATPQSTISAATQYTGTIAWEGNPTTFAANTAYTAKVELTAKDGYQFASDVNPTVAGATEVTGVNVKNSGKTLEFKATFAKTDTVKVTKVQIASTPPSLNVPEALGIGTPGTVTATNTYSVTVFMDGSPVSNPSGVVWSISDLDGVTVDPATGNMTISSDCPGGGITLTATYGGVSSTPATLTVWRATPVAKWLKIVDPATGGEPQTTIMRPVGTALTDWIQVEYKAKVYDQFSQPVNITDIEWTTNP